MNDEITFGYEEGEICQRDRCQGRIKIAPVENCSCHISPPCSECVSNRSFCPECDWSYAEEFGD